MGIVVTIFMLLGLFSLSPVSAIRLKQVKDNQQVANFIGYGLLLAGLWNTLWHGLRYLSHFWGIAALISGVFMVSAAVIILAQYSQTSLAKSTVFQSIFALIKSIQWLILLGLFLCFLLYAVTLVQLNLGYPIIG